MAIIQCLECGNEISDNAIACPKCGFPMKEYNQYVWNEKERLNKEKKEQQKIVDEEYRLQREIERKAKIICHECGKVVGDVEICPYCGFGVREYIKDKEEEKRKQEELDRQIKARIYQASFVECPYCGSYNTHKISFSSRVLSIGLLGIGSGKVGKQWHCNNCRSNF